MLLIFHCAFYTFRMKIKIRNVSVQVYSVSPYFSSKRHHTVNIKLIHELKSNNNTYETCIKSKITPNTKTWKILKYFFCVHRKMTWNAFRHVTRFEQSGNDSFYDCNYLYLKEPKQSRENRKY